MLSRYTTRQGLTWVDLESPTRGEVASLTEEYNLHPVMAEELLTRNERVKVDLYENAIYLALHFPLRNRTTGQVQETEIDFILLKNALITTHYELIDPLHDFAKGFEKEMYLTNPQNNEHAGLLFFAQVRELYKHTAFILEVVEKEIREIEREIFNGQEAKMVVRLSRVNRSLIDIKSALRLHKETLRSLAGACNHLYGNSFEYQLSVIDGEFTHLAQVMNETKEMLSDLRRTNDSLLSTKTNTAMRQLAAVNVIMLPLGLITWTFAMDSKLLNLDDPMRLGAVFGGMVVICILTIVYFRSKKWL